MKRIFLILVLAFLKTSNVFASNVVDEQDWWTVCDNTRHCEAVGYQNEKSKSPEVSLFLSRDAGPATPLKGKISVETPDDTYPDSLTIKVGKIKIGGIDPQADISQSNMKKLIPLLLNASEAKISDGKKTWTLSLSGFKSTLLKMDEHQGRFDTVGALVKKGAMPESSVFPALPVPTLKKAKIHVPKKMDDALLDPILDAITDRSCWEDYPKGEDTDASIARLSNSLVLVMRICGHSLYQAEYGVWIANDKKPYQPREVVFPDVDGTTNRVTNPSFEKGRMSSFAKWRADAGCGSGISWIWDGNKFAIEKAILIPHCAELDGEIELRTWISK